MGLSVGVYVSVYLHLSENMNANAKTWMIFHMTVTHLIYDKSLSWPKGWHALKAQGSFSSNSASGTIQLPFFSISFFISSFLSTSPPPYKQVRECLFPKGVVMGTAKCIYLLCVPHRAPTLAKSGWMNAHRDEYKCPRRVSWDWRLYIHTHLDSLFLCLWLCVCLLVQGSTFEAGPNLKPKPNPNPERATGKVAHFEGARLKRGWSWKAWAPLRCEAGEGAAVLPPTSWPHLLHPEVGMKLLPSTFCLVDERVCVRVYFYFLFFWV